MLEVLPQKPRREDLPAGANLCEYCTAKCCRYLALPAPRNPKTWSDYDEIRWFLTHENISVFVDNDDWYVLIQNQCRHLRSDNLCGIYLRRPQICRDYTTKECEYDEHYLYEKIFEHDDQLFEYAELLLGPRPNLS